MWNYEKRLQYPVNIKNTCPRTASLILSQFGGPDGELSASMRYLAQRYSMPCKEVGGLLDGHRHRGAGTSGDHLRHGLPAHQEPDSRAGKNGRL